MITLRKRQRNTSRVLQALALALGVPYFDYEVRAGKDGRAVGNIWSSKNKDITEQALELLHLGFGVADWKNILLTERDSGGYVMFDES